MASGKYSLAALAGGILLTIIPDAIGADDGFAPETKVVVAAIVSFDLPLPPDVPGLSSRLFGVDPVTTSRLPPEAEPATLSTAGMPTAFLDAVKAYAGGDLATGDRAARLLEPGLYQTSAEWAALRALPRESGFARIERFLAAHSDWPAAAWLRKRSEEALYGDPHDTDLIRATLAARPPQSPAGKLALARVLRLDGDTAGATRLAAEVWRKADVNREIESAMRSEFGAMLTQADHKYRADRLLYKESAGPALRAAEQAGPDAVLLAKARAAVINEAASDAAFAAVPKALQGDPGLLFSNIQKLRRAEKIEAAAASMLKAPRDPALLVDGDEWWVERRMRAREMLDRGEGETAYALSAGHAAQGDEARVEAEFHAGWIALRFLDDPGRAQPHFLRMSAVARNPVSVARAFYWQGRALEALGFGEEAGAAYAKAARHSATFYGQLSRIKLGMAEMPLRMASAPAEGEARAMAVQVSEALLNAGAKETAAALMYDSAQRLDSAADIAALAQVAARARDAHLSLNIGKAATAHGFALDEMAFPTFGVPDFQPLEGSADRSMIYAIARQESAFLPRAASGAGAKGLMQMLVSTARVTARRAKVAFDAGRLQSDPAFNAQLGAAHLGTLMQEQHGSLVLTFAAYNAGGARVKQWVAAHGDPRDPNVDVVDWIELIPITETRNYVQRILENLQVYRARLGQQGRLALESDLRSSDAAAKAVRQAALQGR